MIPGHSEQSETARGENEYQKACVTGLKPLGVAEMNVKFQNNSSFRE